MPIDKLDTLVDGERISESTPKLSDSRRRARVISVQSLEFSSALACITDVIVTILSRMCRSDVQNKTASLALEEGAYNPLRGICNDF